MESELDRRVKSRIDHNKILVQISTNLTNALNTYGASSHQYQTVLEMLKDHLRAIDGSRDQGPQDLDPNTLCLAMGFLEIGK